MSIEDKVDTLLGVQPPMQPPTPIPPPSRNTIPQQPNWGKPPVGLPKKTLAIGISVLMILSFIAGAVVIQMYSNEINGEIVIDPELPQVELCLLDSASSTSEWGNTGEYYPTGDDWTCGSDLLSLTDDFWIRATNTYDTYGAAGNLVFTVTCDEGFNDTDDTDEFPDDITSVVVKLYDWLSGIEDYKQFTIYPDTILPSGADITFDGTNFSVSTEFYLFNSGASGDHIFANVEINFLDDPTGDGSASGTYRINGVAKALAP